MSHPINESVCVFLHDFIPLSFSLPVPFLTTFLGFILIIEDCPKMHVLLVNWSTYTMICVGSIGVQGVWLFYKIRWEKGVEDVLYKAGGSVDFSLWLLGYIRDNPGEFNLVAFCS